MAVDDLQKNAMMAHLLDALDHKKDIGHYGRLVFTMVGRHFLTEEEVVTYLGKDKGFDEDQARALYQQMQGHDYSPPRREKILQYQSEQDFPILPHPDDPDDGNVYRDLQFPEHVYEHISDYREHKAHA